MNIDEVSWTQHLDIEFRDILRQIKPYITCINSTYHLGQYRVWLEKLSKASIVNKARRNFFLRELAMQIKQQTLVPPFTEMPNFSFFSDMESEFSIDEQDCICEPKKTHRESPTMAHNENKITSSKSRVRCSKFKSLPRNVFSSKPFIFYDSQEDKTNPSKESQSRMFRRRHKSCKPMANFDGDSSRAMPLESRKYRSSTTKLETRSNLGVSRNSSYLKMMETVKNVNELLEFKRLDSSSWLDLSESNSTKSKSSADLKEYSNNLNTSEDIAESLDKESLTVKVDSDEDRILTKCVSKDTNVIVTDLKKTIEGLQLRLTETIKQNNELKNEMNCMKKKSPENEKEILEDIESKYFTELHTRDVERFQDMQDESSRKLEESFQSKLERVEHNFQKQLDDLKNTYETKIQFINVDKEVGLKDKDQEISRLNDIIEKQCLRMSNEITSLRAKMVECINSNSNDDKIVFLQKCVAKMDRLFQKAERDYQRQIQKLKNSLEQKEKSMQILLKSQRVEVMSKACAEKQSHFDLMVNNLEIKYVKMLEIQAQQFLATKKKKEYAIDYLRQLLEKHSIAYELNNYND